VAALILQWVTAMDKAVPMDIQLQHSEGMTFDSSILSTADNSVFAKSNNAIQSSTFQSSMQFDESSVPQFITSAVTKDTG
jgi:hypothetical protein